MKMTGVWYVKRWGFSLNEGGEFANFHMQWFRKWCWLFVYVYVFGWRRSWVLARKTNPEQEGRL